MHHKIILRLAVGLVALLIVASLGFAWGVTGRERRLAEHGGQTNVIYTESAGAAAYEQRCGACHAPEQPASWVARQPAATREIDLFNFLQQHGKAPESENRLIARFFAQSAQR
jgi:hypothetical protein